MQHAAVSVATVHILVAQSAKASFGCLIIGGEQLASVKHLAFDGHLNKPLHLRVLHADGSTAVLCRYLRPPDASSPRRQSSDMVRVYYG
jgi:hypothetical protein